MSRFSLSSPFALFQSIVVSDQEATSSSTSSSSAINNSSTSLSLSPAANSQSGSLFGDLHLQHHQQQQQQLQNQLFQHQQHRQHKLTAFRFHHTNDSTSPITTSTTNNTQISKHLLELQREIKEEEDEIFADINSLLNDRSNLYSSSFDAEDDFEENGAICGGLLINPYASTADATFDTIKKSAVTPPPPQQPSLIHLQTKLPPQTPSPSPPLHRVESNFNPEQRHQQTNDDIENVELVAEVEDDIRVEYDQHHEERLELERLKQQGEQQEEDEQIHRDAFTNQQQQEQSFQEAAKQQQRDILELTSNLPKPCVFFLEGNCRRSDCKFSHDLSSIICKYWIEGFCFKGEMCPFSHSLTPLGQDINMLDDEDGGVDGLNDSGSRLNEKALDPTFVIESEADFPSLPLDAPAGLNGLLGDSAIQLKNSKQGALTKSLKTQILSSNPTVVFKTTKKKRKKG